MIKINFSSAISMYLCFSIFLVFTFWIFYNLRRNGILNETKYLHQCPYCTYIFFNYTSTAVASKTTEPEEETTEESFESTLSSPETDKQDDQKSHLLVCPRCQSYIKSENDPSEGENQAPCSEN